MVSLLTLRVCLFLLHLIEVDIVAFLDKIKVFSVNGRKAKLVSWGGGWVESGGEREISGT